MFHLMHTIKFYEYHYSGGSDREIQTTEARISDFLLHTVKPCLLDTPH